MLLLQLNNEGSSSGYNLSGLLMQRQGEWRTTNGTQSADFLHIFLSLSIFFCTHTHTHTQVNPKFLSYDFSLSLSLTHTHTHTRSCTKFSTLTQSFSLSHKSFSACDTRSVARSVLLHLDSCFFFLHVLF